MNLFLILVLVVLYISYIKTKEVYSIGDLHGDYENCVKCLKLAKLINDELNWIGKDKVLIQLGDVLDDGKDGIKIIDLFEKLRIQAEKVNGRVQMILGNHVSFTIIIKN